MNRNNTQKRASKGGEYGANGEWYEGGKFINTVEDNAKRSKKSSKPSRKRQVAPFVWEVQPFENAIAIFQQLSGVEVFDRATGKFSFNSNLTSYFATPEAIANRKEKIERYNRGEKWA